MPTSVKLKKYDLLNLSSQKDMTGKHVLLCLVSLPYALS